MVGCSVGCGALVAGSSTSTHQSRTLSKRLLDFNPTTGLVTSTAFEDGRNVIEYSQDLQPYWDINARYRTEGADRWAQGMKEGIVHAAFVPDLVILDMRTRFGVNFYDKNQRKRVLELIEKEYPHCKVTEKKLA